MTRTIASVRTAVVVTIFAVATATALGGTFDLSWYTINGGGATSTGGGFELSGTIGQADAGAPMAGGDFELTGGFWPGADPSAADVCGDFDSDGDVDLSDFAVFGQCFGGAFNPPAVGCPAGADADCDDDGDVDLSDFALFGQNFTGSL